MRCGSCKITFEQPGFIYCGLCGKKLEDTTAWKSLYPHIPGYMVWYDDEEPKQVEVKDPVIPSPYIGDFPQPYPWTAPPIYPSPWFGIIPPLPYGMYLGTRTRAKTDSNP